MGHSARQCRLQTAGISTCQICNKAGHVESRCYQSKTATDRLKSQIESRSLLTCQICCKTGHTAATCRVKTDKNCAYCQL